MNTSAVSLDSDLFFERLVGSYVDTPRFVARPWLETQVLDKLNQPACHFVMLTAEPGFGKSAFMAQLAHDHPTWPRYFIRRDQRTPLGDVDAKSFLLRIGYQLAALYPSLFTEERIQLSVEQRIGDVAAKGEVVGAEVKRILASPFYQKAVTIRQNVERNAGRVVGLTVEELVIETRQLDPSDLQYMALLDPVCALLKSNPTAHIVVLVDALDEIRYHEVEDNILKWLTNCPELPPNVHFVLSSRPPDEALKLFCDKQAPSLRGLTLTPEDPQMRADVESYARRLATRPDVAVELVQLNIDTDIFVAQAAKKANGNIGYLDAVERAIDAAFARPDGVDRTSLDALLKLRQLPNELGALYGFFLHQIKTGIPGEVRLTDPATGKPVSILLWPEVYSRVLGVLAVALAPLGLDQIIALGSINVGREYVADALNRLLQFLDTEAGGYRLYHATLPEFLTASTTKTDLDTTDLWVDLQFWRRQIIDYYWMNFRKDWMKCDAYGLKNLAIHLLENNDERLHHLITKDWLNAHYVADGYTYGGFLDDVDRAWQAALAQSDAKRRCLSLVRLQAARQLVDQEVKLHSDDDLSMLVWLGRINEAIAHARLRNEPLSRFRSLLTIYSQLQSSQLQPDWQRVLWETALTIGEEWDLQEALTNTVDLMVKAKEFDHALEAVRSGAMKWGRPVAALITIADALINAGEERACAVYAEALALLRSREEQQPLALSRIAYGFWQLNDDRSHAVFDEALAAVTPISNMGMRCEVAREVGIVLARTGDERTDIAFTSALADARTYSETARDKGFQVQLLTKLAVALSQVDDRRADDVFVEAVQIARGAQAELSGMGYTMRLGEIATAFVQVGDLRRALEIARTIEHDWQRAEALMGIAAAAQTEDEHAILDDTRTVANAIESEHYRGEVISKIAIAMARIGDSDQALNLAHSITTRMHMSDALIEIAAILNSNDDPRASAVFADAGKVVPTIERSYPRMEALIKLARALAQAGNYEAALAVARAIEQKRSCLQALREIASVLARAQLAQAAAIYDEVLATARTTGFWHPAIVLCNVAGLLAQKGDSRANTLLTEALDIAQTLRSSIDRAKLLTYVGAFMSQIGDKRADTVFSEVLACAQHLGPEDPDYFQDIIVCNVAAVLARAGEYNRALALIDGMQPALFAGEVLSGLQSQLLSAFHGVRAVALAHTGDVDDALEIARDLDTGERDMGAQRLQNLSQDIQEGLLLTEMLEVAESLELSWGRIEVLIKIATALSQTGNARANDIFAEALADAQVLGDPVRCTKVLISKAASLARTDKANATAVLAEALTTARTIEDKDSTYQAEIFGEIAAMMGDIEQALELARTISNDAYKVIQAEAMSKIAHSLAELGRFEEALGLVRPYGQDYFLLTLTKWSSAFEKVAPGLSLTVLQEATDVAGWLRPEWHKIHNLLAGP